VRAALTGHLVLSTLHTNDALAAIPRLRDLGVESFLLASALRLVAAQRLVRRLCDTCKAPHPESARLAEQHAIPAATFFRATGCPACRERGYRGRLAIHEVVPAEKFLPLIAAHAPLADLAALRDRERHPTLWHRGLLAAARGLTTIEEVARVL
jgi:type II secretory ATPase GspE/PulE/Tfp pilus assembly ATPase PilB-like protein